MRSLPFLLLILALVHPVPSAAQSCRHLLDSAYFSRAETETTLDFIPAKSQPESLLERLSPEQRDRLLKIRETANRDGLHIVILADRVPRNFAEQMELNRLFGANVVVVTNRNQSILKHLKGVVLHLGWATKLIKSVRGDLNPTYTDARTLRRIEAGDKWLDYALVERVAPGQGLMAKSLSVEAVPRFQRFLQAERSDVVRVLTEALEPGRAAFNRHDREILEGFVARFFESVEAELGPSFVKYNGEAQTGDAKDTVTTFKTKPSSLIDTFEADFFKSKTEVGADRNDLQHPYFFDALIEKDHSATYLMKALLFRPRDIMVQERLQLAKYDGVTVEVRVDVLRGIPVNANSRFGYHYLPPEVLKEALDFTAKFFDKLPPEWRRISGGVDVAFVVENGTTRMKVSNVKAKGEEPGEFNKDFMEFNFGADSGFIFAKGETIEANEFVSNILGRPTYLIDTLEINYLSGLRAQKDYFARLQARIKKEKRNLNDISRTEYAGWLVYRYMQDWDGTRPGLTRIINKMSDLFQGYRRENQDLTQILRSLEIYRSRIP